MSNEMTVAAVDYLFGYGESKDAPEVLSEASNGAAYVIVKMSAEVFRQMKPALEALGGPLQVISL